LCVSVGAVVGPFGGGTWVGGGVGLEFGIVVGGVIGNFVGSFVETEVGLAVGTFVGSFVEGVGRLVGWQPNLGASVDVVLTASKSLVDCVGAGGRQGTDAWGSARLDRRLGNNIIRVSGYLRLKLCWLLVR
jgi:hypothetical protein